MFLVRLFYDASSYFSLVLEPPQLVKLEMEIDEEIRREESIKRMVRIFHLSYIMSNRLKGRYVHEYIKP